ncbi:alkaline phosphatase [Phocaeicola plebeius]|uniref:alkaline phosphatase n=1 Tax=Phocaeicola plebeius TaxID=310297 RepID=UPI0026F100A1|nr:alkaline phosphatase [Phocaeicola plebeius]
MKKIGLLLGMFFLLASNVMASNWKAGHVVMIAFDGWGAYSVPKAEIPNIRQLMSEGCYTLKKRSVLPSSSAINWASMFNGAGTEIHGYTEWNSQTPEIPSRVVNKHGVFPTIYSLLDEQCPLAETGCLAEWEGIKYLIDSLAVDYWGLSVNYEEQPQRLCEMAEEYIKSKKPIFVSICFDQLDHVGHADGHDTPSYYNKLNELDAYVGRIIKVLKEIGIYDDTVIIVTADHGGINKGHGGKTLQEMEVPFIISGKNIRSGGEFKESMMQFDTAATIAYALGLKQPQVWIGRPMVQVFENK